MRDMEVALVTGAGHNGPIGTYANGTFHIDGITTETPGSNARSILFQTWDGSAQHNVLTIGNAFLSGTNIRDNGGLYLQSGSNTFGGTGSGTYSHSLGITPTWCGVTDNTGSSTMTVGVASYGSSSVVVTCGAAHLFKAIVV